MTRPHYLNGRILLRQAGGVRRYAREVADHLPECRVLMPRSASHAWSGRVWEQTVLAKQAGDGVLLNVAHSGPLRHPRHVTVVHDLIALQAPNRVHPAYASLVRWQLPKLVAGAQQVVTVSRSVANDLIATFDLCADDIEVVPPGISAAFMPGDRTAARRRLGLAIDRPVVAALLDPTPRKNADQVAAALRHVMALRPDVQIVVAGRVHAPSFARRRSHEPIPRTGFLDLGAAADIELATLYQAADVSVSLTDAEGFGLPQVEAARCGTAVVTTAVPSILEHAPGAAVVIANGAEAIGAVTGLLNEPAQRVELAAKAAESLGDLQWAQTAASLESIMSEVGQQ